MRKVLCSLIVCCTLLISNVLYAKQVKEVTKDTEIHAIISMDDISRIVCVDDPIIDVRLNEGDFDDYQLQEPSGSLFIRPSANNGTKPISVFISTSSSKTYNLLLTPSDVPSEQIFITNINAVVKTNASINPKENYKQSVVNLYKSMKRRETIEGFVIHKLRSKLDINNPIHERRLTTYEGQYLKGEILKISNSKNEPVLLKESNFSKSDTIAVKLDRLTLSPNQSIFMYRIGAK